MSDKFYTSVIKRGNNILLRYIEESGERKQIKVPFKPQLYIKSNEDSGDAQGTNGENLSRINFADIKETQEFIDKYKGVDGFSVYGQKDMVFQFISRYFGKDDLEYKFEYMRIGIVDIEVFSGSIDEEGNPKEGPFPYPEDVNYPVNAITLWDSFDKKYHIFGLEYFDDHYLGTFDPSTLPLDIQEKIKDFDFVYYPFKEESVLLRAYVDMWEQNGYDICSGFNSDGFDYPYLTNRIRKVLGDSAVKKLSPWGMVNDRTLKNDFGQDTQSVEFMGINHLDYMVILKKHGYFTPENWKLNTVADELIGEGKVSYEESKSLNTLYVVDYNKFIAYNMVDVGLIVKMEKKKKLFPFLSFLTYLLKCKMADTLKTTNMWLAYAYNTLHKKGIEPEIKHIQPSRDFVGGYVRDPDPGKHKYVVTIDAESLYPRNGFEAFNMGNMSIISESDSISIRKELCIELNEMIENESNKAQKEYLIKVRKSIRNVELMHEFYWDAPKYLPDFKTLRKLNICMTPNVVFFKKYAYGIWADIASTLYTRRRRVKDRMLGVDGQIELLKLEYKKTNNIDLTEKIERLTELSENLYTEQYGIKTALNSLYGATANKYFAEYFDQRLSEGVTTAGQVGIQWVGKRINEHFQKFTNTKESFIGGGDTDSLFLIMETVVKNHFKGKEFTESEGVKYLADLFLNTIEPLLMEWTDELAKSLNANNRLKFKLEKIAGVGIWGNKKKRYVIGLNYKEGTFYETPKMTITGFEAIRSTYKKQWRDWLKETYKIALYGSEEDVQKKVSEVDKKFRGLSPHDIATVAPANDIEKYLFNGVLGKGATKQVKAAVNYNNFRKKCKLGGTDIVSGQKILHINLVKNNPYGIDVIGFPDYLPEEFGMNKFIDYESIFKKNYLDPITNFLSPLKWTPEKQYSALSFF